MNKLTSHLVALLMLPLFLTACGGGGGGGTSVGVTSTGTTTTSKTLIPNDGKYVVTNFVGVAPTPTAAFAYEGNQGGVAIANDAALGFVVCDYKSNGVSLRGALCWAEGATGAWTLVASSANVSSNNDAGQLIVSQGPGGSLAIAQTVVTRAVGGAVTSVTLAPPAGRQISGLLNNGNIISIGYTTTATAVYDQNFNVLSSVTGTWSGFGRDGLLYGTDAAGVQSVRFSDGSIQTLPCNALAVSGGLPLTSTPLIGAGSAGPTQPATGRNCTAINHASASGIVVGRYFNSNGSQGVYRFSKAGFEEIPLDPNFFTTLNASSGGSGITSINGVANDGTILISGRYDGNKCTNGPFLIEGTAVVDLVLYIPTQSCFNTQPKISGGGVVFMASQAQVLNISIAKKK